MLTYLLSHCSCKLACRLAYGRTLDSKQVVNLVKAVLQKPKLLDPDPEIEDTYFGSVVNKLRSLYPGRHLGSEGILDLLEFCMESG